MRGRRGQITGPAQFDHTSKGDEMRIFKFRSWNTKTEGWFHLDGTDTLGIFDDEEYVIEQFTGLKDGKGIEVYEGDILGVIGEKSEEPKRWAVRYFNTNYSAAFDFGCMPSILYCEVLGNIHENPELFK